MTPTTLRAPDGCEWRLAYTTNGLIAFEEETGTDVLALLNAGNLNLRSLRALVWAGLLEHQPGMSLAGAGQVIDACGIKPAADRAGLAVAEAFRMEPTPGKAGSPKESRSGNARRGSASTGAPPG